MKHQLGHALRVLLTVAILVLLVLFARRVNWIETWHAIRSASATMFLAALLVNLLSLALKGVRWWVFLRPVGVTSLSLALRATFAGAGLNNVLVANGGEAARVIFVSRTAHVSSAKVLATFALERLFEFIGYVLLLVLGIWLLPLPSYLAQLRPFALLALVAVTALMIFLVLKDAREDHRSDPSGWIAHLRAYVRGFINTLSHVSTGPRFVIALLLSIGSWGLQIATYHMTAMAVHFPITFTGTVAAILAVNIAFAIRPTPGNVGVFQALYALAAGALGFDTNDATAVAILIQAQQILPVTAIGIALAPEFILRRKRPPAPPSSDPVVP
jgi:uncharacterized protein (TIRG00374 family)